MDSLIIVVGGTGKSVAAVYLMLAKFFGKPADVVVLDMRFGGEDIDKELDKEGIKQEDFMTPWPGGATSVSGVRFAEMIGLTRGDVAEPVAKTLFSDSELNTLVEKGMNARPIVGATVAMRKFFGAQPDQQVDNLRQRVAPYTDIFVVGSITGGTGSGVMPTLGRWLTEKCGKRVHGILFLPWIKLGAGSGDGPSDADLQANAYAVLNYLKETDPATNSLRKDFAPFHDYVVIGNPSGLEPDASATSGSHPLSLAAATYLVYFEEILTRNPEAQSGPYYLELTSGGIRAAEMQPRRGFSLEQAINRQDWFSTVLQNMANQKPDEAWDLAAVVPGWLAWRALRTTVRGLALMSEGRSARGNVWQKMSEYFRERGLVASGHLSRFGAITSRDKKHLVYDISMETLEKQAKGYRRRALAAAKSAETPNLNSKLSWDNAAKAAAEKISEDVFANLGRLATESITTGGAPRQAKEGSSTVFLPGGVEDAEGGIQTIARKPLGNLDGLIQKYAGVVEAINMPTPEARRFQFEITLEQALADYLRDQSRPKAKYDSSEPLAQFTALLEGVILGTLQIKLFDLESYGFKTSPERRILGVLMDKYGEIYGGTAPETLVFPAPGSWDSKTGALRRLSHDNVTKRDEQAGQFARQLLQKFRASFLDGNRSLWMRAIDEYLHVYPPPDTNVNEQTLNSGWKQAGPIQLRMPDKSIDARYLPVFEADFASRATNALSGEFTYRDNEIHLKTGNSEVGRIFYPETVSRGLTLRLMGAGSINILPSAAASVSTKVNYDKLQDRCQALIGDTMARVNRTNVADNPFKYPDVIRLPFERDGIIAEHYLTGGKDDEKYGRQFLNAARGSAMSSLPRLPDQKSAPALVVEDQTTRYFVDQNEIIYVERYEGVEIGELRLLGQALWSIFIGEGTEVQSKRIFVDGGGKVLLEYDSHRLMPGSDLVLTQPDPHLKAADLRCLAHKIAQAATDGLFKEAVTSWLNHFSLNPVAGVCDRVQINIGGKNWWRP
jgi:hypothetical protein